MKCQRCEEKEAIWIYKIEVIPMRNNDSPTMEQNTTRICQECHSQATNTKIDDLFHPEHWRDRDRPSWA